jgi:hypothetical protein
MAAFQPGESNGAGCAGIGDSDAENVRQRRFMPPLHGAEARRFMVLRRNEMSPRTTSV